MFSCPTLRSFRIPVDRLSTIGISHSNSANHTVNELFGCAVLPIIVPMVKEGLITLQDVEVISTGTD